MMPFSRRGEAAMTSEAMARAKPPRAVAVAGSSSTPQMAIFLRDIMVLLGRCQPPSAENLVRGPRCQFYGSAKIAVRSLKRTLQ